ncbi:unnamed protein product [Prorocentrum cordatum]|uniref:GYD domain-containing protein n=1 Tax=Prorocentrum cordatum TaxID=2364126 RepID=A0ABN9PTV0_9DINO|nr:unnamed protein product [Polarella glacialis]
MQLHQQSWIQIGGYHIPGLKKSRSVVASPAVLRQQVSGEMVRYAATGPNTILYLMVMGPRAEAARTAAGLPALVARRVAAGRLPRGGSAAAGAGPAEQRAHRALAVPREAATA